jgi:hypothetical protein
MASVHLTADGIVTGSVLQAGIEIGDGVIAEAGPLGRASLSISP